MLGFCPIGFSEFIEDGENLTGDGDDDLIDDLGLGGEFGDVDMGGRFGECGGEAESDEEEDGWQHRKLRTI